MIKVNFNKWIYGAYCGMVIQCLIFGEYKIALMPLGFLFMFIGYELILNQYKYNKMVEFVSVATGEGEGK